MNGRDSILNRLRKAAKQKKKIGLPVFEDQAIYRDFPGTTQEKLLQQFAERFLALQGEFFVAGSPKEAAEKLLALLENAGGGDILAQQDPFIDKIFSQNDLLRKNMTVHHQLNRDARIFAQYAVGITRADFLIARTGSILLRSTSAGGRRLSVLPPFHIVLAEPSQLIPSLDAAFLAYEKDHEDWSYAAIITGPSRTADIEKILVLGAHGPKRLAVLVVATNL